MENKDDSDMFQSFLAALLVTTLLIHLKANNQKVMTKLQLQILLDKYVAEENYEKAAKVRDLIATFAE